MEEIWKPIKNFEDYFVSNLGRVKSTKYREERILKQGRNDSHNGKKYYKVVLCRGPKVYSKRVNILVAEAFLDYVSTNKTNIVVDHIDNNGLNNSINNLQLISHRLNILKDSKAKSKYPGVHWRERHKIWEVSICFNNKDFYLGSSKDEEEASLLYKEVYDDLEKGVFDLNKYILKREQQKLINKTKRHENRQYKKESPKS